MQLSCFEVQVTPFECQYLTAPHPRAELQQNYPNPLYEGESSDNANKSAYPKTFSEPLTFELYEHHIEISEAAKP